MTASLGTNLSENANIRRMSADDPHRSRKKSIGQTQPLIAWRGEDAPFEEILPWVKATKSALNQVDEAVLEGYVRLVCAMVWNAALGKAIERFAQAAERFANARQTSILMSESGWRK